MRKSLFPVWRSPWASLRPRLQHMRQQSLAQLDLLLAPWLPAGLLSQTDTGRNSRDRVFTVRRTFYGFLYQVLNPKCSCRQVVRQIQALFALQEQGPVDENSSAYCQARRRLPLHICSVPRSFGEVFPFDFVVKREAVASC